MKKSEINDILTIINNVWNNNILQDYNKGLLLNEDTLKCAMYYHLRRKLSSFIRDNHLSIYTEYTGPEFNKLNKIPDMVIIKFKDNCNEEYLINHVSEVVFAFEFKFKNSYDYDSIYADCFKIKDYIKKVDNNCHYILAVIQEAYNPEPFWLEKKQTDHWAKGRVTELVASYSSEECEVMNFQSRTY